MTTRRTSLATIAAMLAYPLHLPAQQQAVLPRRIGILGAETEAGQAPRLRALLEGIAKHGYVPGKNLTVEYRWADGNYERLPDLAVELIRSKVELIVALGIKAATAAKQATSTVPIIIPGTADPIASGLVTNLGRPGGNITGSSFFGPEMAVKQLELMKEAMPRLTRAAALVNPKNPASLPAIASLERAAKLLKLDMRRFDVLTVADLASAFASMEKARVEGVVVVTDTLFLAASRQIGNLAERGRILLTGMPLYAEVGFGIGYGPNQNDLYRQAGVHVDKVLKGIKPSEIPFEQATHFELVLNMKVIKALGITIPASVMVRATKVIE